MSETNHPTYPLLEEILSILSLQLKPTYTTRDVAAIFGVTPRAILVFADIKPGPSQWIYGIS
jgi:hypothetical protein